jgi:hypothetical protein
VTELPAVAHAELVAGALRCALATLTSQAVALAFG